MKYEFAEICESIELEKVAKATGWSELWSTPGNRWRSWILLWCGIAKQCSGNGLVSYYLHDMLVAAGITSQLDQTLITATSAMFSFACSMAFAFLPARVGRRPLLLWSMGLMWVVFTIITVCTGVFKSNGSIPASYATVAFIYLYSGVHNLGWTGAMMVYVVEILPYSIRAKGIAFFWLLTGASGAFNTYINPLGIAAYDWVRLHNRNYIDDLANFRHQKFYWFYVGWIIVQFAVVYFTFIETKGPSLEGVALLFDGRDAKVGKVNAVAEAMKVEKEGYEEKDNGVVTQVENTNEKRDH